ncbi:unnamed protein product [Didymodactylos carnosus]|uniref:MATH domain-containing protein n=1 Tax=Didymodactylos carnosus TaxID=1234261 RepID=A0A814SBL2_9BILA|nr:unnamed protein product [Didymodactylos carnosus]CAF1447375.1 unnamed protein product [Didymodactylos carnosus]CAF3908873.1 unnamed protein product [Didymodactylos carnosus]CAF4242740.1 unnamed protein product [Didymodactylos carnosus]
MAIQYHVILLHASMNSKNKLPSSNKSHLAATTVNPLVENTQQTEVDELHNEISKLHEALPVLTKGVQMLQEGCTSINNELIPITDLLNKCQQEINQSRQTILANNSSINSVQLNQDVLQQEAIYLKEGMENIASASYDGTYLWKVKNVAELMRYAQSEQQTSVYSTPFYSSRNGYKMCMRLYLNGDGNARRTHLSLFFVVMRGEYDAILKWPFSYKITFCLFDQSGQQRHIIDSFRPNIESNSFQQPQMDMNIASGISKFFPLTMLQQDEHSYVKNDTIFIKCIVNFNDIPRPVFPYAFNLNPALPDHVIQSMIKAEIERRQEVSIKS